VAQVTVVIPAKNAASTIGLTLASLKAQTFSHFDVVVVDDGSSDHTGDIARSQAGHLSLQVLRHEESQGVARSINAAVAMSHAPLIARLDADDMARQDRLAVQMDFMQSHPEVMVCGTDMAVFSVGQDAAVHAHVMQHPRGHDDIVTALVQRTALAHPSLLLRRALFDTVGGYDPCFDMAEDYDLWTRGALLGMRYANIAQPLTYYRWHSGQVSQSRVHVQKERDLAVKKKYIAAWLGSDDIAYAAEVLSPTHRFKNREQAIEAFDASLPMLMALGRQLPGAEEYQRILQESVQRHLTPGS
jgi:glycosyltransferase involved in cell wall biosynthesis